MGRIARVLLGGRVDEAYIAGMERSLFAVIDDPLKQLSSFFLCIVLSAVVATGGVAAASPAIIIGAMIIAPLMMPIMGTSFAIARGRPRQALKALAVAAGGALVVVAVACLVTALLPAGVPLSGNPEVTSRTEPRVVDLVVAVASGFVGALAAARDDIGEALPGVAVAVSIVPPLCVAGAALTQGALAMAAGALLLFLVNFFSIQLAGNLAFFLMGFGRCGREGAAARRLWYATAVVGTLLVMAPLVASSNRIVQSATDEHAANAAVRQWLEGSGYEAVSVKTSEDGVTVEIAGTGPSPSVDDLASLLRDGRVEVGEARAMVVHEDRAPVEP
ncbi:DUF389 domain-containing protein [Gordonibacter sp. 28C]|uniref:DUF389 domain-containing protein n=1 Tax=Gordonibacter sp. 28C TaxID=2078569 RepID=UPI000DF829B7|nr:DUF389 domain-containing protein [Gordonibacter sp. 28C]RDB63095.1 DUF389 domain-containing protein [Gordonibacter sp. 28C]